MAILFKASGEVSKVEIDSMKEVQILVEGEVKVVAVSTIHYMLYSHSTVKNEIASEIADIEIFGNAVLILCDEFEKLK